MRFEASLSFAMLVPLPISGGGLALLDEVIDGGPTVHRWHRSDVREVGLWRGSNRVGPGW